MTTTICPKCRHVREADVAVPSWQCPQCGVAYAKASDTAAPALRATSWTPSPRTRFAEGTPWGRIVLGIALVGGIWAAVQNLPAMAPRPDLPKLAAATGPGDVVMFSTSTCPYCKQAASWMSQYGFAFTECNTETDATCAQKFRAYGGNGVPYLVVKDHHMTRGFDSDEFLRALVP